MYLRLLVIVVTVFIIKSAWAGDNEEITVNNLNRSNSSENTEKVFSTGYGMAAGGFTFLGGAVLAESFIISMGKKGNLGGVIALSLVGGACEIGSPLLMSGGATKVQRVYENKLGLGTSHNWTLYKIGLAFTIASKVIGFLPVGKDTLYSKTETSGYSTTTKTISYSPFSFWIAVVGQCFYLANGIHAVSYISKVKKQAQNESAFKIRIVPIADLRGKYGFELVGVF